MREILFRGKRIDNGEWVEGSLLNYRPHYEWTVIRLWDNNDGMLEMSRHDVNPSTVGQYTGLRDCKRTTEYPEGQRIFDGDIVRHHNGYPDSEIKEIGVVFWCEEYCGWRRTSNGKFHHGAVDTYRLSPDCVYEVIGNIHDNPELLEVNHDER